MHSYPQLPRHLLGLFVLLFSLSGYSQSAAFNGLNYQAVVRDASGQPLPNQNVGVQILIRESPFDISGYVENHNVTSDAQGLITLIIGYGIVDGSSVVANFGDVDWPSAPAMDYTVSMDISGGTNYQNVGGGTLQAVPYAIHALTSDNSAWVVNGDDMNNTNIGNVGIGTTSPQFPLTLEANNYGFIHRSIDVELGTYIGNCGGDDRGGWIGTKSNSPLYLFTNDACPTVSLTSGGLLGIGTTQPEAKLHVNGDLKITDGSEGLGKVLTSDADGLASWSTPAGGVTGWSLLGNDLSNTNSGNVGIGTTTPASKLEVMGGSVLFGGTDGGRLYLSRSGAQGHYIDFRGGYDFADDNSLTFRSVNNGSFNNRMTLTGAGSVGVGTTDPMTKLDVRGKIQAVNVGNPTATNDRLEMYADGIRSYIRSYGDDQGLEIESTLASRIYLKANDTYCTGKLFAREVEVTLATFPDYVFDADYKLMPLAEVEAFISENGHLPNVPSACEVEENGIGLGEMNRILLEKVEELTLHLIEQERLIKDQGAALNELRMNLDPLKTDKN